METVVLDDRQRAVPLLGTGFLNRVNRSREGELHTLPSATQRDSPAGRRPRKGRDAEFPIQAGRVLSFSISAYAEWLWIDSKFSASTT